MFVIQTNENVSPSCTSLTPVLLKRLPVFTQNLSVFAYELFPYTRRAETVDQDSKLADLLINTLVNFDLDEIVGAANIILPITSRIADEIEHLPFDKQRVLYQVDASILTNQVSKAQINHLIHQGYRFIVNGNSRLKENISLFKAIHYIKFNTTYLNKDNIKELALADKQNIILSHIKTREEFDYYCNIGFNLCQGYFLGQSVIYKTKNIGSDLTHLIEVLASVNSPETSVDALVDLIRKDIALSYKLLRLINSPYYNLKVSVDSVHQALVLLGHNELRVWVTLILMSGRDDLPSIVSELVLYRAKFCELLAEHAGLKDKDVFFTAGMFSGLDMVLNASLASILEKLPLSELMKQALLHEEGQLGQAVKCAKAYERGNLEQLTFERCDDFVIGRSFEKAVAWSYDVMRCI